MNKVCIYMPYWTKDPHCSNNPFVPSLIDELGRSKEVQFYYDKNFLWEKACEEVSMIHIMWPNILDYPDKSAKDVEKRLLYLKVKGIRIIYTCHNMRPHTANVKWSSLYEVVSRCTDVFVHMGGYSRKICERDYPSSVHVLIPHHVYDKVLPPPEGGDRVCATEEANPEKQCNISEQTSRNIICVGAFRTKQERNFIIKLSKELRNDKYVIYAPSFFELRNGLKGICSRTFLKWLYLRFSCPNLIIKGGFMTNDEMKDLFSVCGIVLIQRPEILNSGNVPLGFYYGKVVVGPFVGNVGELLVKTGNPVFSPTDMNDVVRNVHVARELACQGHGVLNRRYCLHEWSTNKVAGMYMHLYKEMFNGISNK